MTQGRVTSIGFGRLLVRASVVLVCGLLPLVTLWYAISPVAFGDRQAVDFHYNYYYAAEDVRAGENFYPSEGFVVRGDNDLIVDYVYPPLLALLTVPWTFIPIGLAEVLFQLVLVGVVAATLAVLGVRDWRCYGLAFLWPPVTDGITVGNVSLLLGLAAALTWRYRDRATLAGAAVGVSIATKIFLWPLTVWLAATRRVAAAAWSVGIACAVIIVSWAIVGFRGMADYPDLVQRLSDRMDERGYTLYALGVDLGLGPGPSRAVWAALALATLAGILFVARAGNERGAFVLALAATIAFSPIVWLHYFSLLLVAIAIVQPRLGYLWFLGLPLQLLVSTGFDNGPTYQTIGVLVAAGLTVVLAFRETSEKRLVTPVSSPAAARS
jgi:alpha-1,2-mannosyltransferase